MCYMVILIGGNKNQFMNTQKCDCQYRGTSDHKTFLYSKCIYSIVYSVNVVDGRELCPLVFSRIIRT